LRQLQKLPEPAVLASNSGRWTEAYVSAEEKKRKNHEKWGTPEIKQTLDTETNGKCAYCEAFIGDVSYPHVEHIIPKSLHPELAHSWANLTLACQTCNTNKGNFYGLENSVLNPYQDAVSAYLDFHGPFVTSRLGQARGEITVMKLQLNRAQLFTSRTSRLAAVKQLLERWHSADGVQKELLAEALAFDADEGEFSVYVWNFLEKMGFPRMHDTEVESTESVAERLLAAD
jgi:uncharacterized protein (TIGR02646 family)